MGIFSQPLVSDFPEAKLALHDAEGMFHSRTNSGFSTVKVALSFRQCLVAATFLLSQIQCIGSRFVDRVTFSTVSRITKDQLFLAMQQVANDDRVVNIGARGHHRVNQLGFRIHANMGFHSEVPLVAFLGLTHIRIALLLLVLGRTGRTDDAGINDGAAVHFQAILFQILVNQVEELVSQIAFFHEVAEFADGCLVRRRLSAQVNTDKATHSTGIVNRLFSGGIRELKPVLQEVDAQHSLNADRTTPRTLRVGIKRRDGIHQSLPGNDAIHVFEKLLLTGFLAVLLKVICQRELLHRIFSGPLSEDPIIPHRKN